MSRNLRGTAMAVAAGLALASVTAVADDHAYTEGPVVTVERIRTVDGKFDEYVQWLDTKWKAMQEAAKKKGYILSYQVYTPDPRTPDDADVILMITFKNWAALDGALAKGDEISKEIEGTVSAANQAQYDRAKIRRVLGSQTMQEIKLK